MGFIHNEVETNYPLSPAERALLQPFLNGFNVSWARQYEKFNAKVSAFLLKPEGFMTQTFGIESEICLFFTSYESLQDRTIQAANAFMQEQPALGRVDPSLFFLVTNDPEHFNWISDYQARNPQTRTCVTFYAEDLKGTKDAHFLRNKIAKQLFTRDLFDYQLPVDNDLFFFGRESLVQDYIDAIRKSQNRGLFGLRKTGKTSTLLKIKRFCDENKIAKVLYFDCKLPSIRSLTWQEFLKRIIGELGYTVSGTEHVSDKFLKAIKSLSKQKKVCLIFDEVEFVSPISPFDPHWQTDFVPFWQTLWSTQSQVRSLSFIIAGVNPYIAEQDKFGGGQNPIFGIVKPFYLKGFETSDTRKMVKSFGRRMGLVFDETAIAYLQDRYGGHPLLVRMACSYTHFKHDAAKLDRPISISSTALSKDEMEREVDILPYGRHVVSEIKDFYPDEYALLELLALGQSADYWELSAEPEWVRHIQAYGIVSSGREQRPRFLIPVLERYIAAEAKKRGGARDDAKVNAVDRPAWLKRRVEQIAGGYRSLETSFARAYANSVYPGASLAEADKLPLLGVSQNLSQLSSFCLQLYRSLVEPVYKSGRYAFESKLPNLVSALEDIRVMRHYFGHTTLRTEVQKKAEEIILKIAGKNSAVLVDDDSSVIQQYLMDNLFLAIQIELQKLS